MDSLGTCCAPAGTSPTRAAAGAWLDFAGARGPALAVAEPEAGAEAGGAPIARGITSSRLARLAGKPGLRVFPNGGGGGPGGKAGGETVPTET